jgi:hypothetical protein
MQKQSQEQYSLVRDPVFYLMLAFFALLTTAMPAALGQPRFLPFAQTIALFAFLALAVRQRKMPQALLILAIWLILQIIALILTTWLLPGQVERAISDGFAYRTAFLGWFYGAGALPGSLTVQPAMRLVEMFGIIFGSLLTGGLLGVWFLVRAANLAAYGAGALAHDSGLFFNSIAGLPLWTLLRLAGYAGLVALLAEPLFSRNWSPAYYLASRRRLLLGSASLLALGLLLEIALPGAWRTLFQGKVDR